MSQQHIFVYGDSLSWGIIPLTRRRFPFESRWPGVMENRLNEARPHIAGQRVGVTEDCLNGRRTLWEDPFKPGRNGLIGLAQKMEVHAPLDLVILMLGANDFQFSHPYNTAWSAAQGVATLVNAIRQAPIEPGMPVPPILVVCPPPIGTPKGPVAAKFEGADSRCLGLATAYREMAAAQNCPFFDAAEVTTSSKVDGIHLDEDQHLALGEALAGVVDTILPARETASA
ncbi:MAG TPA: SGNH/GDSL hydrolase family protein [Bryobacteraceae bacterium]|nr:SGNH/GDSL hydrolase family protein [Bryobacteraceae bacterium]